MTTRTVSIFLLLALVVSGCRQQTRQILIEVPSSRKDEVASVVLRELSDAVNLHKNGSVGGGGPQRKEDGSFNRQLKWNDAESAPLSVSFQQWNSSRPGPGPHGLMIHWADASASGEHPSHQAMANRIMTALATQGLAQGVLMVINLNYEDGKISEQE